MGTIERALTWTRAAFDHFRRAQSPEAIAAQHNLAIIQSARGSLSRQAAVLEELARYWLRRGDPQKAETICWEAIDLLDVQEDGFVRGRVYRILGGIAARQGNLAQARNLLRVSFETLRRLKATAEASVTLEELEKVVHNMVPSAG